MDPHCIEGGMGIHSDGLTIRVTTPSVKKHSALPLE